jgi:hypothetical protein
MKIDSVLFLERTSIQAFLLQKCCGNVSGGFVACHFVSSDPYYLHIQLAAKTAGAAWGDWFIPHSTVLMFTQGPEKEIKRVMGFSTSESCP